MKNALVVKKAKKSAKSKESPQQLLQKLQKKVESLRKEQEKCEKALNEDLTFYAEQIFPKQKEFCELLKTQIELLYPYLKSKKQFSKKERGHLKSILLSLFEKRAIFQQADEPIDPFLDKIFKELTGYSNQEAKLSEFEEFKSSLEEECAKYGMDVDLSDITMDGSQQDLFEKVFDSIGDAKEKFFEEENSRPKSKKQLEKEQRAQEVADLQKKEISTVYKQLAKIFHPDLEEDPALKIEKEALMKKLTVAYEERDLQTLLELEMRWLTQDKVYNENQIKIYTQVLKEQIGALEGELYMKFQHPRYFPLHSFVSYEWKKGSRVLEEALLELLQQMNAHKKTLKNLQHKEPAEEVRSLIQSQSAYEALQQVWFLD